VYRSSLSLMHPLVADVFRLRVESEAPLQWADVHYAVLQADEAELANNQTALRQRQINFMMQSESNTAFVLNYVSRWAASTADEHSGLSVWRFDCPSLSHSCAALSLLSPLPVSIPSDLLFPFVR